jgi:hypothetical protein
MAHDVLQAARIRSYELPVELWENIIHEMVAIEDSGKDLTAGKWRLWYNAFFHDKKCLNRDVLMWRKSLRSLRLIVLVCRLWRDIFTPFLYSTLHITHQGACGAASSHQIVEILNSRPNYRHYVRRLDIWSTELATECAFLISLCDRLQILGVPKDFPWTEVARLVPEMPGIKHLSIRRSQPVIFEPSARTPSGRPLALSAPFLLIVPALPNLHTLQALVDSDRLLYSPCSLPSLHTLKLATLSALSYRMLWRVAVTLQEVEISGFRISTDSWWATLTPTPFPSLRKITVVNLLEFASWLPSVFPPPNSVLQTLQIQGSSFHVVQGVKDALAIKLKYGKEWAPNLEIIRAQAYACEHVAKCKKLCIEIDKGAEWRACQNTARALYIRLEIERVDAI